MSDEEQKPVEGDIIDVDEDADLIDRIWDTIDDSDD